MYCSIVFGVVTALVAWVVVYRLFFHPLRGIPGPWTARLFGWHELYHNIWRDGEWCKTFPSLHKKYNSPVVRIGANHVHIRDIDAYEHIFRLGSDFYKDESFYTCADNHGSIFSLSDRGEHRERRKALAPKFSKQAAELAAPKVQEKLKDLLDTMTQRSGNGGSCNITDLFRAVAINWVAQTLLGNCNDLVDYGPSKPDMLQDIDGLSALIATRRYLPYLSTLNSLLPSFIADYLAPAGVTRFKKICEDITRPLLTAPVENITHKMQASVVELLIAHRLEISDKPPTLAYLAEEAFTFIDAGVDTTGGTLVTAVYHVLRNPDILRELRKELDETIGVQSDSADLDPRKLSDLPYLNAIIKESHRIWPALPGPLPRVVPPAGLTVGRHFIPGGTIVSATHHSLHYNERVFPDPKAFKPERWLATEKGDRERYLNPYSRGTRACIGINLAQMQLRLTLSYLFSFYDVELCEPVSEWHDWKDHFIAHPKKPVLVTIRDRRSGNI
ncbi:cytochrome P450 [Aspergillus filifer]